MSKPPLNKKILIVDDEEMVLQMLRLLLKRKVTTCLAANNGRTALEVLRGEDDVDCVITDISMPEMDGYELKASIDANWPGTTVVALTGHTDEGHLKKMREYNFRAIFTKPVGRTDLERLLDLCRESASSG